MVALELRRRLPSGPGACGDRFDLRRSASVSLSARAATLAARCAREVAPTMTAATPGRIEREPAAATLAMSQPRRSATRRSAPEAPEISPSPPNSSMMSLYLTSERFASGLSRLRLAEPAIGEKAARDRAVADEANAMSPAQGRKAVLRPAVENRILHLHRGERNASLDDGAHVIACQNSCRR